MKKKYNFFIFDLDGVIFDSKENMFFSWNATKKKFKLKPTFASYFKNIGKPFDEIMKSINIKPNNRITKCYKDNSLKHIKKVKLYSNVRKILQILNRRNIKFSIVTSKDITRTKFLLNKFKIYPHSIHCPRKNILGKPNPKMLFSAIKKNRLNDLKSCYVGDTHIDQQAAKNAGIDFILAKYGYGNKKFRKNQSSIKSFKDLKSYIM